MDLPRYKFNSHNDGDLLDFLKTANECKNETCCDLDEYEKLKILFPLEEGTKVKLEQYPQNIKEFIDITSDDEDMNQESLLKADDDNIIKEISSMLEHSSVRKEISDMVDTIKDILMSKDEMPDSVFNDLSSLKNEELNQVFESLNSKLNLDEVERFWHSLDSYHTLCETIIPHYIRRLFLPKIKEVYNTDIQGIFVAHMEKYTDIFRRILVEDFLEQALSQVLMSYVLSTSVKFKTNLLRDFLTSTQKLKEYYIPIIEALLNPQTDVNVASQVIELMSNSAYEFVNDNSYGKLLFNVVNCIKNHIPKLEQPLKHILSIHQSIWKIKVQKIVVANLEESFSQSFR
ncbi:uncharacterized protein LOC115887108 [Sitophilus oryzae]|uniref:Uncharacterized protein LOC115887108 n=1 Tax=Sitophilus oryzae TaxID=7048 RepID=A0A6J2YFU9_SITOR|nr:uncharacterized protein LOC115887108 [Sitophilus oryzae]